VFQLDGKVVLITGACGGIAAAALQQFKDAGARVIGVDRNLDKLKQLKRKKLLRDVVAGDLTTSALQDEIVERFGASVDVLINNVGAGFSKTLEDTTREDYLELWKLNFEVAAMLSRGMMPRMAARGGGKVINVSTVLAEHPLPTVSAYVASKAALTAFTKAVALQFAPLNVQANVLAPGYVQNAKHEAYFKTEHGKNFLDRFVPTGVVGERDAVTGALLYLSSALSDYMTGHVLIVDGGYSIW
jgi:NAD(P)-dependent dehydrogenase (short-subunit alcohol dehydrogenase family)